MTTMACRVCERSVERLVGGRCAACRQYLYRTGNERPKNVRRGRRVRDHLPNGGTCRNCGREERYGCAGRCRACRLYLLRTGKERPSSVDVFRHGYRGTKTYRAWASAKTRCFNPKSADREHYGGRGITMCPEWRDDFRAFLRDVGPCPGPGWSIDRINNDGNYEPGNVRWATYSEQNRNRRPWDRARRGAAA